MKKFLSVVLSVSLLLGLLAGIGITAGAEEATNTIAITGVTAPVAGQAPVVTGVTGAPDGFALSVKWQKYDYIAAAFGDYTDATFVDNGVYRAVVELQATADAYIAVTTMSATI